MDCAVSSALLGYVIHSVALCAHAMGDKQGDYYLSCTFRYRILPACDEQKGHTSEYRFHQFPDVAYPSPYYVVFIVYSLFLQTSGFYLSANVVKPSVQSILTFHLQQPLQALQNR